MSNTQNSKGDYSQGSISKTVIRMAIPITLAELVHVLYNLVDRMYIGHIKGVGTAALSGVGIAFPLITLIGAFANLCGTGGNPLCSIARGEGDNEKAGRILKSAFTMLLISGAALTVIMYLFAEPLLGLMGGDAETLPYALDYFKIYAIGIIPVLISLGMNPFINGMGFTRIGMGTVLIGAALNIVLDPLFIFTMDMGIKGAAIATVISQAVSAVWVIIFLTGKKTLLKLDGLALDRTESGRIIKLGVTGFMFKFSNSVAQAIVNMTLKQFGGAASTLYIGAMSIINSLREVVMMPISGITTAAVPVMSFNYGAKLYSRVKKTIRFMFGSSFIYNLAAWALVMFVPVPLIKIFTTDPTLISTTVTCLRIYFAVYFLMTMQSSGQNTFIALNKPKFAVFFSTLRKLILIVPFTIILPRVGFGVLGVFYAETFSQIIGATACFLTMIFTQYKKLPEDAADLSKE